METSRSALDNCPSSPEGRINREEHIKWINPRTWSLFFYTLKRTIFLSRNTQQSSLRAWKMDRHGQSGYLVESQTNRQERNWINSKTRRPRSKTIPTMPRSVTQNSTDDILINHRSVSSSVSLLLFQFEDCICLTTLFMLSPTTMVLSLFSPDKKKDAGVVSQVSVGGLSRPTELRAWVRRCGEGDLPTALQVAIHMRAATRCEKRVVDGKVHLRVSTRGDVTKGWVGINIAAGAQVCV